MYTSVLILAGMFIVVGCISEIGKYFFEGKDNE